MKSTGFFVALCFIAVFFEGCKKDQTPSAPTVSQLNSNLAAVGLAPDVVAGATPGAGVGTTVTAPAASR